MERSDREQLLRSLGEVFGDDQPRIDHAKRVLAYAEQILGDEPGDEQTVVAAAILHDIGIAEAERKHGSSAAKYQELEGPPIARGILESTGLSEDRVDHICRIIGSHHSARDIDSPEFRIIWDADWLVNIPAGRTERGEEELRKLVSTVFRTDAGRRIARETLLPSF